MFIHKSVIVDNEKLEHLPFIREIAMEAYLIENPSVLSIDTEGLREVEILDYEVPLPNGRSDKDSDGRIDILAKYCQEYLAIIELKIDQITTRHLNQLQSYLKERKAILGTLNNKNANTIWDTNISAEPKWIGVMVGSTIEPQLMNQIRTGNFKDAPSEQIPIAALTINRYRARNGGIYTITDTYFPDTLRNRDYTKYLFRGETYGKGRLVLAVVKDFVDRHRAQEITFSQLKEQFPDQLQGSKGVFAAKDDTVGTKERYFSKPEEMITLSDRTEIAVSNQWGNNINRFLAHCQKLSIEIKAQSSGESG